MIILVCYLSIYVSFVSCSFSFSLPFYVHAIFRAIRSRFLVLLVCKDKILSVTLIYFHNVLPELINMKFFTLAVRESVFTLLHF